METLRYLVWLVWQRPISTAEACAWWAGITLALWLLVWLWAHRKTK